jgi:DUF4097 and DUF4098 domain-containing protein YvlB
MSSGANLSTRIVAAALPLLLVSGFAHAGHKLQREDRKTVDVDGQTLIIINNARGKMIVVGERCAKKVTIVAEKWVHAKNAETAQAIMDVLEFDVEVEGETIALISKLPKAARKDHSFWSVVKGGKQNAYIDFTIEVPYEFSVQTSTTSGNVQVTNVAGLAHVSATSGDVLLREIGGTSVVELTSGNMEPGEIGGDLRVAASSGNAEIRRVRGFVAVQATSGNVFAYEVGGDAMVNLITGDLELKGCLGDVNFSTSSGSAMLKGIKGSVNATSSHGDLNVAIVPIGEKEFYLSTSSGNVVLHYVAADNYGFLLDVNTCTGTIKGDLEITQLDQVTRRKLKGVVGNGKARVVIETASGNVSIVERTGKSKKH